MNRNTVLTALAGIIAGLYTGFNELAPASLAIAIATVILVLSTFHNPTHKPKPVHIVLAGAVAVIIAVVVMELPAAAVITAATVILSTAGRRATIFTSGSRPDNRGYRP